MTVQAIGGLFFRAKDPDALARWYAKHLNVGPGCGSWGSRCVDWAWWSAGGPVVFTPFADDSEYFPSDRRFMINFRVNDLDSLLTRLRAAGIEIQSGMGRSRGRPVRAHPRSRRQSD